jgi:uncharacterized membrane protein
MRGHRDLERVSIAAIVCALVAALVPWEIVRTVAAVPLCLFLPGYALVAAAFGSRELAPPKRLLLTVAVSLMVLVIGTFFLNIFPFGLRTASWAVLLPLVVIAAARWAALSRNAPKAQRAAGFSLPRPSTSSVVLTSIALLIGVGALVLAQKPLPAKNAVGYTALWILPSSAESEGDVVIGVISNEQEPASFWVEVEMGRREPQVFNFRLDPGEERTFEVTAPITSGRNRVHVVATLYHKDRPQQLYRRVSTWLPRQNTFP